MRDERHESDAAAPDPSEGEGADEGTRPPPPLVSGGRHPRVWLAIASAIGAIVALWRCA